MEDVVPVAVCQPSQQLEIERLKKGGGKGLNVGWPDISRSC